MESDNTNTHTSTQRPNKRAKYTSAACLQCKQRKAKCVRNAGEEQCERCRSFGEPCTFPQTRPAQPYVDGRFAQMEDVMRTMQRRIDRLETELDAVHQSSPRTTQRSGNTAISEGPSTRVGRHRQLPFVGRTRPAFSFDVARSSMREMGLSADISGPPSIAATPEPELSDAAPEPPMPLDPLLRLSKSEVTKALATFSDEVHSVYPFVDIDELLGQAEKFFAVTEPSQHHTLAAGNCRDFMVLRVAVAVGKVIQAFGSNTTSTRLVEFVESAVFGSRISSQATYRETTATALMSLYYFHIDQELLAWRTIGFAARMALELGLHRRESLTKNFQDPEKLAAAVKLFWCIYVLDRRWSIGISLPFTLQDDDIDPELPEPSRDAAYLQCMIKYGRICSKVWHAFPSFGPHTKSIPEETVSYLEFTIQNWIKSVPLQLRWSNARISLNDHTANDGITPRLSALLYLRSIHLQILINRHHIISTFNIRNDPQGAQRVVDLAKDSIQVLVEINDSSNIYISQQVAFNFFLISSLAAIFLAVCHEPYSFGPQCKDTFFKAVDLVRGLSVRSHASKRLWKSIRGLQSEARKLGLHQSKNDEHNLEKRSAGSISHGRVTPLQGTTPARPGIYSGTSLEQQHNASGAADSSSHGPWDASSNSISFGNELPVTYDLPDIDQMTSDMTDWYEIFGLPSENGNPFNVPTGLENETSAPLVDRREFSLLFQELLST